MEAIDEANKLQTLQSSTPISKPTNFAWNSLPPLSPHDIISFDGKNYKNFDSFKSSKGLPPHKNHRRSSSDIPLGFSAMIQSSPQLIPISGQTFSCNVGIKKEAKSEEIGNLMNLDIAVRECSENEVESMVNGKKENEFPNNSIEKTDSMLKIRSNLGGDFGPITTHFRSVSMDIFMGDLDLYEPNKLGNSIGEKSIINSMDTNSSKFSLEFGNGEFTGAELRKIMVNDKLAEIALSDPKRVKRILANRQSAAKSKERKMRYISELEIKVQSLQTEANTLSTQLALMEIDTCGLSNQNNELKFRLQAMEQQAQLKDALNEALTAEVQRLRTATVEIRPSMACLGTTK